MSVLTRRTALRRGGPIKRTPWRAQPTDAHLAYEAELAAMMPALRARSRGRCQVHLTGCKGVATTPHHRKLRSQGGSNSLFNLLHVCSKCHQRIHANPMSSYISGFLVRSYLDPEDIPVLVGLREAWA